MCTFPIVFSDLYFLTCILPTCILQIWVCGTVFRSAFFELHFLELIYVYFLACLCWFDFPICMCSTCSSRFVFPELCFPICILKTVFLACMSQLVFFRLVFPDVYFRFEFSELYFRCVFPNVYVPICIFRVVFPVFLSTTFLFQLTIPDLYFRFVFPKCIFRLIFPD